MDDALDIAASEYIEKVGYNILMKIGGDVVFVPKKIK